MFWTKRVTKADLADQIAALSKQVTSLQTELEVRLDRIDKGEQKEMIALSDLAKVEAAERADLATLSGLVTQILTAVASGQMDQTAAGALLDSMNADDATVKSNITTIQAALPTPPPAAPVTTDGPVTGGTAPAA